MTIYTEGTFGTESTFGIDSRPLVLRTSGSKNFRGNDGYDNAKLVKFQWTKFFMPASFSAKGGQAVVHRKNLHAFAIA